MNSETTLLIGKKFPVLNDGFVCLIDVMGTDEDIVQAARVSYGKGTRTVNDDVNLIRYLMRHRHTTPFEMVEFKFLVRVPMDCWRQWIRHRMASVNEYSTRYSEAIDSQQLTPPNLWRTQSTSNKQGSGQYLDKWPDEYPDTVESREYTVGEFLSSQEKDFHTKAKELYEERLKLGVAREQARKDLPLSTYTEAYWKIDLHNLLHFLSLRMDSHAQYEIRQYATIIGQDIVAKVVPYTWQAFVDYRLNSITLSGPEVENFKKWAQTHSLSAHMMELSTNKRESDETVSKLKKLGLMGD